MDRKRYTRHINQLVRWRMDTEHLSCWRKDMEWNPNSFKKNEDNYIDNDKIMAKLTKILTYSFSLSIYIYKYIFICLVPITN